LISISTSRHMQDLMDGEVPQLAIWDFVSFENKHYIYVYISGKNKYQVVVNPTDEQINSLCLYAMLTSNALWNRLVDAEKAREKPEIRIDSLKQLLELIKSDDLGSKTWEFHLFHKGYYVYVYKNSEKKYLAFPDIVCYGKERCPYPDTGSIETEDLLQRYSK